MYIPLNQLTMEALLIILALIIVVAIPQLIVNRFFSNHDSISSETTIRETDISVGCPFTVVYSAKSSKEDILEIIPPKIEGLSIIDGPLYKKKTSREHCVEFHLSANHHGEVKFSPAAILLKNEKLYEDNKVEPIILNIKK